MSGGTGAQPAYRRVHPATVPLRFLKEAPRSLLALPAALAYASDVSWSVVLFFVAAMAALGIVYNVLVWRAFRYRVGDNQIMIESGLLQRNRRSIPFGRIQDVDIERGLLQRLFGLAKVRIETGGAAKDEGLLDSVTVMEAARVRGAVRAWREGEGSFGVAAGDDGAPLKQAERTVFAMALPRVFLTGLFNFSLVWIAGLFAFLRSFQDWLPFDIYDPGRWVGLVGTSVGDRFTWGATIALAMLALLLGLATGVARTLARDYGFRLSLEGERFRRERGLVTRSEVVLPRRRVQLALVRSGPLRRLFGWAMLSFQTLGAARTGAGGEGGGMQSVAPLARGAEIKAILAAHGEVRLPRAEELRRVSRRHLLRVAAATLAAPVAAILAAAAAWPPALLLLASAPALLGVALIERRHHRYGLRDGLLFIERGCLRRRLWIVPVANAQTLKLRRGLVQRRLGLASLLVDTAGAPSVGGAWIVDLRLETARALAAEIGAAQLSGRKSGTDR